MHTSRRIPRNTSAKVDCEWNTMLENYRPHRCIDPRVKVHIEKGQRTGRCLRHLLALSSSKDKPCIGNTHILSPRFFAFLSFTFVNSFRNRAHFDLDSIYPRSAGQIKIDPSVYFRQFTRVRENKRTKDKYLGYTNIVKVRNNN